LTVPGHELSPIFTLRTVQDANSIVAAAEGKNVVIIGSSFIGLETATCIVKKAKSIVVVYEPRTWKSTDIDSNITLFIDCKKKRKVNHYYSWMQGNGEGCLRASSRTDGGPGDSKGSPVTSYSFYGSPTME
jgi:hypothetical protein